MKGRTVDIPDSVQTAREKLAKLRDSLMRNNFIWAADCLGTYLDGRAKSLDEAFGVKPRTPRGAPVRKSARDLRIARDMLAFRLARTKSSKGGKMSICAKEEEIAEREGISDEREVRRIYKRHFVQVAAEEISRHLSKKKE